MVNLAKGQKISLEKVAQDAGIAGGLSKVFAGLGWDTNKYDGGEAFDLDASVFMTDAAGKTISDNHFVYYGTDKNSPSYVNLGVEHMGDNRTGAGDGDDEVIKIDLSAIPADVAKLAVSVTIYDAEKRKQNFGMVSNAYIRVVDDATGTELIRYDLGEDYSVETAIVVAEFYRNGAEWKFNAIGSGFAGGLAALCNNFGLSVG